MNVIIAQALAYLVVFFLCMFIISRLLKGFFWAWLSVRFLNRDNQKVLVKLRTISKPFYKVGRLVEGDVVFKVKKSERRINNIPRTALYTDFGITWIEVDDEKNAIIDFQELITAIEGVDSDKMNSLYLRALYKPSIMETSTQIIIIILIVIGLISLYNAYALYTLGKNIGLVLREISIIRGYLGNLTISI